MAECDHFSRIDFASLDQPVRAGHAFAAAPSANHHPPSPCTPPYRPSIRPCVDSIPSTRPYRPLRRRPCPRHFPSLETTSVMEERAAEGPSKHRPRLPQPRTTHHAPRTTPCTPACAAPTSPMPVDRIAGRGARASMSATTNHLSPPPSPSSCPALSLVRQWASRHAPSTYRPDTTAPSSRTGQIPLSPRLLACTHAHGARSPAADHGGARSWDFSPLSCPVRLHLHLPLRLHGCRVVPGWPMSRIPLRPSPSPG